MIKGNVVFPLAKANTPAICTGICIRAPLLRLGAEQRRYDLGEEAAISPALAEIADRVAYHR